jgi:hypothetical protein
MARDIEATPTKYKGVRFRSRLEAQWAVFWDELGVKWEYEPLTFKFLDGKQYTPDFWIVDLALWVEIKPNAKIAREEEAKSKCSRLAWATGDLVYLDQSGMTWYTEEYCEYSGFPIPLGSWIYSVLFLYCRDDVWQEDDVFESENHYWATCSNCGKIGISRSARSSIPIRGLNRDIFSCECYTRHHSLNSNSEIVMKAYDKALRFGAKKNQNFLS